MDPQSDIERFPSTKGEKSTRCAFGMIRKMKGGGVTWYGIKRVEKK